MATTDAYSQGGDGGGRRRLTFCMKWTITAVIIIFVYLHENGTTNRISALDIQHFQLIIIIC